jgi:hypothetical protein
MLDAEPWLKGPRELSRHEKLHTGREWQCARCPAAFQKESMLRYHHEKVHLQLVSHVCQATRAKEKSRTGDPLLFGANPNGFGSSSATDPTDPNSFFSDLRDAKKYFSIFFLIT